MRNMALVHRQKFLRDDRDLDGRDKAEQLYELALQALPISTSLPSSLQRIILWIQPGVMNNLGSLMCYRRAGDPQACQEARSYFSEVMRVLNFVEQGEKSSEDHAFHSV